jgi:AbrB family looped-hinge helix DNA binding protein
MSLVKIKDKGQVTLLARLREHHGLRAGDYVDVRKEGDRIVLIRQAAAPRHPDIDQVIAAGLADVRAGRVTPAFDGMEDYKDWRKTSEGRKFAKPS